MRNSSEFETFADYSDMDAYDSDPLTWQVAAQMSAFGVLLLAMVLAAVGVAALGQPVEVMR